MPFGFGRGKGRGGWGRGRGFRGGRDPGGPPTNCICPNCSLIVPHKLALPCFRTKCPRCGSLMTRRFLYEEK